jgi:hypothetical protein
VKKEYERYNLRENKMEWDKDNKKELEKAEDNNEEEEVKASSCCLWSERNMQFIDGLM